MTIIDNINPNRILWCSREYQLPIKEIAEKTNISINTLQAVVEGKKNNLTLKQLQLLGKLFNTGILFFLDANPVNESIMFSPLFRTLTNQKPEITYKLKSFIQNVEKHRNIFLNLLEETQSNYNLNWFPNHLRITIKDLKSTILQVRGWLDLSETLNFNHFRNSLELKGIHVLLSNGHAGQWQFSKDDKIRGFSLFYDTCPVIVINKQNSEEAQSFTLAHELGHLLLHRHSSIDTNEDFNQYQGIEKDANEFAGQLLVPDEFLKQIDFDLIKRLTHPQEYDHHLKTFAQKWGVSVEVILRRLLENNIVSQNNYSTYHFQKSGATNNNKSGGQRYRFKEPLNIFGRQYVSTVLEAYNQEKITLNKTSNYLDNLKISYIKELEQYVRN